MQRTGIRYTGCSARRNPRRNKQPSPTEQGQYGESHAICSRCSQRFEQKANGLSGVQPERVRVGRDESRNGTGRASWFCPVLIHAAKHRKCSRGIVGSVGRRDIDSGDTNGKSGWTGHSTYLSMERSRIFPASGWGIKRSADTLSRATNPLLTI